jgi:hypothetical protein
MIKSCTIKYGCIPTLIDYVTIRLVAITGSSGGNKPTEQPRTTYTDCGRILTV